MMPAICLLWEDHRRSPVHATQPDVSSLKVVDAGGLPIPFLTEAHPEDDQRPLRTSGSYPYALK